MAVPNGYYIGAGGWIYRTSDDSGPFYKDIDGNLWHPGGGAVINNSGFLTPNVWKSFSGLLLLTPQTLWTPAAGKKFLLMGYNMSSGILGGAVQLLDNAAALLTIPFAVVNQNIDGALGNGVLSAASDNSLRVSGGLTQTVSGYVYGREQ